MNCSRNGCLRESHKFVAIEAINHCVYVISLCKEHILEHHSKLQEKEEKLIPDLWKEAGVELKTNEIP